MAKKKKKKKVKKKALNKNNKKRARKTSPIKKSVTKRRKKIKIKIKQRSTKTQYSKKKNLFLIKFIKLQEDILQKFKFKINFSLDKKIKSFFDAIDEKIQAYKAIRIEEKAKIKLRELERLEKEKIEIERKRKEEKELEFKLKEQALKEEKKLERERAKDIKIFLRKEQALIRKEQAERQKKFLKELKIEQQIERFRIREVKELAKLESISLKEQREDYAGLQERIEKLKEKYRLIRDQKIRERVEALGVDIQEGADRETLLHKEREYYLARQKIEMALESFYRSANSLVFQLNKRHLTKNMSIFRCIDRRFETGEIFIKWDDSSDEDWLLLIYIKDNSPDKGIIIEDKTNPEKNLSYEFKSSEIFKASDIMVDSFTQLLSRKRAVKNN
mgnify:CR=1 FL=1|tara:strand:+ start:53 stop:1219 length:1167 start_codon:yes stop_codon:yes gene_type:complete